MGKVAAEALQAVLLDDASEAGLAAPVCGLPKSQISGGVTAMSKPADPPEGGGCTDHSGRVDMRQDLEVELSSYVGSPAEQPQHASSLYRTASGQPVSVTLLLKNWRGHLRWAMTSDGTRSLRPSGPISRRH